MNDLLEERYRDAGLETHRVAEDPERVNLVGVRAGAGGGRSLILNGHIDTVPPVEADRGSAAAPGARRSSTGASTASARPT